jgi:hypothetical protein
MMQQALTLWEGFSLSDVSALLDETFPLMSPESLVARRNRSLDDEDAEIDFVRRNCARPGT